MAERRPLREAGAPCWSALVCRHERIVAAWRQAGTLGEGSARSGLSDTYGRVLYSANCGCQAPIGLVAHATTPTAEYWLALPQVAENEGEIRAIRVQLREEPCGVAVGGEKLNDGFEVENLILMPYGRALGAAVLEEFLARVSQLIAASGNSLLFEAAVIKAWRAERDSEDKGPSTYWHTSLDIESLIVDLFSSMARG